MNAAGVLFFAKDTGRHLYLLRNDTKHPSCWSLPGGKVERGETLRDAAHRECNEEIGFGLTGHKLFPLDQYNSSDGRFTYHTLYAIVDKEFIPKLNDEHLAYCWCNSDIHPKPLHPALFGALSYSIIQQKIAIIQESIK